MALSCKRVTTMWQPGPACQPRPESYARC